MGEPVRRTVCVPVGEPARRTFCPYEFWHHGLRKVVCGATLIGGCPSLLFCVDSDDTVDVVLLVLLFHIHVEYFACMAYALMHDAAGL